MGTMMLLMLIKTYDSSACPDYLRLSLSQGSGGKVLPQLSGIHLLSNFCCIGRHSQKILTKPNLYVDLLSAAKYFTCSGTYAQVK